MHFFFIIWSTKEALYIYIRVPLSHIHIHTYIQLQYIMKLKHLPLVLSGERGRELIFYYRVKANHFLGEEESCLCSRMWAFGTRRNEKVLYLWMRPRLYHKRGNGSRVNSYQIWKANGSREEKKEDILYNYSMLIWTFVTLYRRQGSRPSHGKEMQKGKMAVWGGLTNSCEKERSKNQRRKGKIFPFECRVSKNSQER